MKVVDESTGLLGLFATKCFSFGDEIVSEVPILVAADVSKAFASQNNNLKTSHSNTNNIIQGMLGAATAFSLLVKDDIKRTAILSLHHPTKDSSEGKLLKEQAKEALAFCKKHGKGALQSMLTKQNEEDVLKVMQIYAYNAIDGCLFETLSHVNHSCNPNSIRCSRVGANACNATLRAVSNISIGDPITVSSSNLGVFIWSGRETRRKLLLKSNYLVCQCSRCRSGDDVACCFPCPNCHKRDKKKRLEDSVIWEESQISYIYPHQDGTLQCTQCEYQSTTATCPEFILIEKITDKVVGRLTGAGVNDNKINNDHNDITAAELEMDEQLYQVAASVAGARHWTTNLMLLSILNRSIRSFDAAMMLGELPPFEELAESIDSLERIWKFAEDQPLITPAATAALLHRPTLGVARSLVALGDAKSRKYGSEWAQRIALYVRTFESEDLGKVIARVLSQPDQQGEEDANMEESTLDQHLEEDAYNTKKARRD